jgi:DNA polymerase-1
MAARKFEMQDTVKPKAGSDCVLLVDLANHVHADWHATGERAADTTLRRVEALAERLRPISVSIAVESKGPTFRHGLIDGYKGDRPKSDADLVAQMQRAIDLCRDNEWEVIGAEGFEADDALATAAEIALNQFGLNVVIASKDKDLRQLLVDGRLSLLLGASRRDGNLELDWMTAADLLARYDLRPDQWIDYQCLVGDPTDSIVGARGIGDKTARAILQKAGTLEAAWQNPWALPVSEKVRISLSELRKRIDVVRQLVTLRRDVDIQWVP